MTEDQKIIIVHERRNGCDGGCCGCVFLAGVVGVVVFAVLCFLSVV